MDNNVLAKVAGQEITRADMLEIMRAIPQNQMAQFSTPEGRKTILNEMINRELFYLDAVEKNYEADEKFQKMLDDAKHSILQQYAIQKKLATIKVEEDSIKDYYEKHKQQFMGQAEVKAKHILVKDEETAKKVVEEINGGKSFEDAAKEYSQCPSKAKGGDLGYFSRGKMVKEFEDAAFNLEVGKISDIVKTQFGYHIITVEDKKEAKERSFEEVKAQIKSYLLRQKQTLVYTDYANSLKGKYDIEINEEALK